MQVRRVEKFSRKWIFTLTNVMEKWIVNDICHFIADKGFHEDVLDLFSLNRVRGEVLPLITDGDLKELGVAALSDRKLLLKAFQTASVN